MRSMTGKAKKRETKADEAAHACRLLNFGQTMQIADGVIRLTASNSGPFTGSGTNTYLLTFGASTVVIDPGPADESHTRAILAAAPLPISHILLTHAHRDHSDGIASLKEGTGAVTAGFGRNRAHASVHSAETSPSGGDFADRGFVPEIKLADGDLLRAGNLEIQAIHTPGHAPDHLCFAIPGTPVLFSGDHVMGWSTSVIAPPEGNMGLYLSSLEKLLARPETRYLPGHGDLIEDASRTVRAYLIHRQMRERAVLDCICAGAATIQSITDKVYAGLAPALSNAARLSVIAHAELLAEKGLVSFGTPLRPGTPVHPA